MSRTTPIMGLSQGDECISSAAKTLCWPAGKHTIPVSWIALHKDAIPPQKVFRSSLQQLQPTRGFPPKAAKEVRFLLMGK